MEYPVGFDSSTMNNKPICAVLALAVVCGVSYDVAHATCKTALFELYPNRKRFGGGTTLRINDLVMNRLGVKFERHDISKNRILRLHDLVPRLKRDTLYLVRTPGHIQVVMNNAVMDQHQHVNYLLRKNTKVTHWYEILGKGW